MKTIAIVFFSFLIWHPSSGESVPVWQKLELVFKSDCMYDNPIYDMEDFHAEFISPSGRKRVVNGFWAGGLKWLIRFMPDETGTWTYLTRAADEENEGLDGVSGSFECTSPESELDIYRRGCLMLEKGSYHFSYADGTPFFWLACTAWNGGLKSTSEEWEKYLEQRASLGYNVIQLVATQWRGCERNSRGEVAFTGCGRIRLNPDFFDLMDEKIDQINEHGHIAALVLLWALPFGEGREFSPGYYLPDQECIRLARYIVARYQGNHVTWVLGGDGKYYGELEDRWKFIGQQVFRDDPYGLVTLHPHGLSWIGELYDDEEWFDFTGYQSTHGTSERHINFINRSIATGWKSISPMPVINMEPCYEQIRNEIFEDDVRNACYWSVFAAPPSGVTYGHDGTWPWLRKGEKPEHHTYTPEVDTWDKGIELPGIRQIAWLGGFFRNINWTDMLPAQELLMEQPGDTDFRQHVSVLSTQDRSTVLVYFPVPLEARILLPTNGIKEAIWFNPVENSYRKAETQLTGRILKASNPFGKDAVLILNTQ